MKTITQSFFFWPVVASCILFSLVGYVATILPFVYLFKEKRWYANVIKGIAIIISVIGVLWGFQRIFL